MPFVRAIPVALLLALAAPAVAHASATLSVTGSAPHKTLIVGADDGSAFGHRTTASIVSGDLLIEDDVGIAIGTSTCTSVDPRTANCGTATDFEQVVFTFGDTNDRLEIVGDFPIDVSADGGAGDDVLAGGSLDDELVGGPGGDIIDGSTGDDELVGGDGRDFLSGEGGADVFDGGEGDDRLWSRDSPGDADAAISCGPGTDALIADDGVDELPDDCETTTTAPPQLDGPLVIDGEPRVGGLLALSIPANVGGDGEVAIQWQRCDAAGDACVSVGGDAAYTPTAADQGSRLRAWYWVENELGYDVVTSEATDTVRAADPSPPTTHPTPHPTPHPHPTPRPPGPVVAGRTRLLGPFLVARAPSFAIRNGKPLVDTGRSIRCVGAPTGSCQLSVTARPSGPSARLHGRPAIAGEAHVPVTGGVQKKVTFSLNPAAYRLLRAHRKLTLSVTAVLARPGYVSSQATFTITVKAPKRHRR